MHRGLVALSASAVAAIYMAGYLRTQAADASIGAESVPTPAAVVAAAPPAATPTLQPVIQRAAPPLSRQAPTALPTTAPASRAQPTPAPQVAAPPAQAPSQSQTQGQYRDGTYTGQGTSRRGDVWVSLQVAGGHITNVTITRSTLQYPLRDIRNLPQQVVDRQSAQVDLVSRATYSSMAFRGAVAQALASARA